VQNGPVTHTSRWSHLFADTQEELHEFAARLGLRRSYYQGPPEHEIWHYDLTEGKRWQAIRQGAVTVITWRESTELHPVTRARHPETGSAQPDDAELAAAAALFAEAVDVLRSAGQGAEPTADVALDADAADLEAGRAYQRGDFGLAASLIRDARELAPDRDQHWTARQERIQQAAAARGLRAQTAARLAAAGITAEDKGLQQVACHNAAAQRAAQLGREAWQ
jgi:hypothetical protein